jgi:hypothetical protein
MITLSATPEWGGALCAVQRWVGDQQGYLVCASATTPTESRYAWQVRSWTELGFKIPHQRHLAAIAWC